MELIAGILAVGLVIHSLWREWLSHQERIKLAQVYKAKDLGEVEYVFGGKKSEEEDEPDSGLVGLEQIPEGLGVEE